jgi:protein involved in polysaccharide export with SLBB domain
MIRPSSMRHTLEKCLQGIFSFVAMAFAFSLLALSQAHAQAPLPKDVESLLSTYKLAAGDVITIRVFGEEDLSREKSASPTPAPFPTPCWARCVPRV